MGSGSFSGGAHCHPTGWRCSYGGHLPAAGAEFCAAEIKHLREALKFSQPVFALHLHTTASTVRKWGQGDAHPAGPALKLLNSIANKGLQAII